MHIAHAVNTPLPKDFWHTGNDALASVRDQKGVATALHHCIVCSSSLAQLGRLSVPPAGDEPT